MKQKKGQLKKDKNRMEFFSITFNKVNQILNESKLSDSEQKFFILMNSIWFLNSGVELMKIFISLLLDEGKINANKMMYGQLIEKICDELHYGKDERQKIKDLFLVGFRNAISHNNYNVTSERLEYDNYGNRITLNFNQVINLIHHIETVTNTVTKFMNKKSTELDEKLLELNKKKQETEDKINQIENQIQQVKIQRANDKIKMEKRLDRRSEKINRKFELLERKSKKKKGQTGRIISKSENSSSSQYNNLQDSEQ